MKIKYYLISLLSVLILGLVIAGCSDLQKNIPTTPQLSVHQPGNLDPASPNFHGNVVKANNWSMKECQNCHAADYSGGTTGASCKSCHKAPQGPEACNTCHGNFADTTYTFIAPPRDVNGDTSTASLTVGAHTSHLYNNTLGNTIPCNTCHVVPSSVYASGHLDATPDNIITLSGTAITNIASNASFDPNAGTCANTYCHGNFKYRKSSAVSTNQFAFTDSVMVGNNVTVQWNKVDGSQAVCGSCHDLPPKGHIGPIPLTECFTCHGNVVDENGNIINQSLHINGTADVRGSVVSSSIKQILIKNKTVK